MSLSSDHTTPTRRPLIGLALAGLTALSLGLAPTVAHAEPVALTHAPATGVSTAVNAGGYLDLTMAGQATVTRQVESEVGPGIRLTEFERLEPRGWQQGAVLDIDLANPEVSLDYLDTGVVAGNATLTEMASEATNIQAAVNGDFFDINNSGAAHGIGVDPVEGIIKSPNYSPGNALVLDENGIAQITQTWLAGSVYAAGFTAPIGTVNSIHVPTTGVGVYTSRWGDYQRASGVPEKERGLEVWIDADSKVIKTAQRVGAGPIPAGQRVIVARNGSLPALLESLKIGDSLQVAYAIRSDAANPILAVGGGAELVKDGQPLPSADATVHPRTAAGVTQAGTRLLLAVIDGRSADSRGMSLTELGQFMHQIGSQEAFNLDGGGSTTLVTQQPGDDSTTVVNTPSDGYERSDANGIGVQVAPGTGILNGYTVSPTIAQPTQPRVFPGLHLPLRAKGFDENSWPVNTAPGLWTSSSGAATVTDGLVTGVTRGTATITAATGEADGSVDVRVLGQLDRITVSPNTLAVPDATKPLRVQVTGYDDDGFGAVIDPSDVTVIGGEDLIEFRPGSDATFVARALKDTGSATLTLTVGDLSAELAVTIGTDTVEITSMEGADQWDTYGARSVNSVAPSSEGHGEGDSESLAATLNFNTQTGTRTANLRPSAALLESYPVLDGATQSVGAWFKGGPGLNPMVYFQIEDASGAWTALYGDRIAGTGWQYISVPVPQNLPMPISVQRIGLYETVAANQYSTTVLVDDINAVVAPTVAPPNTPVYAVDEVDSEGEADEAPLRIAVMSDAQFVGRNPDSVYVQAAREALRRIVAEQPDRVLILGDFVDEGAQIDIDLAKRVIDEELVPSGIPWTYVPGNHEAMGAPDLAPFKAVFGETQTATDVDGTRIITLNSAPYNVSHDPAQIKFLNDQLNGAITDPSISGVVLALHHPTRDLVTNASALNDPQDAALIEGWTAKVREAGKSVIVLGAGVGAFDVYEVDGVVHSVTGNSGKGPHSTPDRGGFTGWTMVGLDPSAGLWREATGEWLNLELNPFVDDLTITGPEALAAGELGDLDGTIVQDGREVPAAWPVSYTWNGTADLVYVGDSAAAPEGALVALNPVTGEVTALERQVIDGAIGTPVAWTRPSGKVATYPVDVTLTVNGTVASHQVQVTVPTATNALAVSVDCDHLSVETAGLPTGTEVTLTVTIHNGQVRTIVDPSVDQVAFARKYSKVTAVVATATLDGQVLTTGTDTAPSSCAYMARKPGKRR